jgi:transcription termination/antitermination protein NusA
MIKIGSALVEYAEQLERERGIARDFILDALKDAMLAAYKRYAKLPDTENLVCKLVERTGEIGIYEKKWVVDAFIEPPEPEIEEVEIEYDEEGNPIERAEITGEEEPSEPAEPAEAPLDEASTEEGEAVEAAEPEEPSEPPIPEVRHQILLRDARKVKADIDTGDWVELEVTPSDFGRIAAQSAKQVIMQRIRDAEKLLIQKEFEEKQGSVVPGIIQRLEGTNVVVSIGRSEAVLPKREQIYGENYRVGNKLRVFVLELRENTRSPQIIVTQAHPQMVREVFELEVPEIEDGLVEIKAIAREAGHRTKVAVHSNDPDVDPQGACIGTRGSRIQAIVNELRNEKIDIIRWSDNSAEFIVNALAPARILEVRMEESETARRALVIVPDEQLSLAIGREGQNVRLAAKLTNFKLDIKSVSQFEQLRQQLMEARHLQEQHQLHAEELAEYAEEDAQAEREFAMEDTEPSYPQEETEAAPAESLEDPVSEQA